MIAGEPGLGKSQIAIGLAAAVTTGGSWPDAESRSPTGSVIILSAEDGLADTIRPRFDAAGGDARLVTVVRAVNGSHQGSNRRRSFDLSSDLSLLEEEIEKQADTRLVLIDPVSSYLGKIDSHKNAEVRNALEPLADMAERRRVAVVAITHLSKGDGKAINRFIGSIAFVAAARTAFAVVSDPDDDAGPRRLLLQVKNNIAPPQPGLAFRLLQREVAPGVVGSAVAWENASVNMTVDQALKANAGDKDGTAKDDALEFLRELLEAGPVDVLDIEAEARAAAMLSETRRLKESKPFREAAKDLGVVRKRHGFGPGARVQWFLPDNPPCAGGE
jgi:RecA/RadA recombinase